MMKKMVQNFAAIFAMVFIGSTSVYAQGTLEERRAAADRYLKTVPLVKMLDDTFAEISKQVPAEQRAQFVSEMTGVVRADFLEELSRESMVQLFTADELNALADFYGSQHGSSAMSKFPAYMAQIMPAIQAEVQRGLQQLQQQKQQQRQSTS